jgi:hypothetical protein
MKRLTKNRIDILYHLTVGHPDCGLPPYSVSSVHYMIQGHSRYDIKDLEQRRRIYNSQLGQVRRTLNDLASDGLLIMGRELNPDGVDSRLPYWETVYQIAAMAEQNHFEKELSDIERKISSAYNGFGTLFGGKPDGKGLTAKENAELTKRVKGIIQKSHPDKGGNVYRFKAMKTCLDMLRKMPVMAN